MVLLGALTLFSCDNPVALGRKLNLDPPVVTIDTPAFMADVSGILKITGTAIDLDEVVSIDVSVERVNKTGAEWKREWKGERGTWRGDARLSATWSGKQNINWSIEIDLGVEGVNADRAPDGEYAITASAVNSVKTAGPKVERRVRIDNEPPVVEIILPCDPALQESFSGFDAYTLRDPLIIERLHNQQIKVQYEIKDSFSIDTLTFQLADSNGKIYYDKPVDKPTWNGVTYINAEDIKDPDTGLEITGNNKKYLQILSRAADKAGNEDTDNHGFLVYWPEADKPWAQGVGHESNPQQARIFPRMDVSGQAYDDDGVQSVTIQIFYRDNNNPYPGYESPVVLPNTPMNAGATPSTFFPWKFSAPEESGEYYITIKCTDINGLEGDSITRYFFVLNTAAASVEVTAPVSTAPLFGGANGAFNITGRAGDVTEAARLDIVWINPKGDPKSQILYQSSDYQNDTVNNAGWNRAASGGVTDGFGNKIWTVAFTSANTQDPVDRRYYKNFSHALNLFGTGGTQLNIGPGANENPLTAQTFILRVQGAAVNGSKAITVLHSVQGDTNPPQLGITKVTVGRSGVNKTYNLPLPSGQAMDALDVGDTISLEGWWDDDSAAAWGTSPIRMSPLDITWNGAPVPNGSRLTATAFSPAPAGVPQAKTWAAGPLTLTADIIAIKGGRIEANLKDYGGNVAEAAQSVLVDSNVPYLMSITSANADGAYNSGAINISLVFNKAVKVDTAPTLRLNIAGATVDAAYAHSVGYEDKTHTFIYNIVNTHNTPAGAWLNVTAINPSTATWSGSGGKVALALPDGTNLGDLKKIKIDTTPPVIESIQSSADNNSYLGAGKQIYVLVKFSEDITFNGSATLTLNSNTTSTGVTGPVVTTTAAKLLGTDTLQFTYAVTAGQNTPFTTTGTPANVTYTTPLRATLFAMAANAVQDLAQNLTNLTIPSANIDSGDAPKNIYIDTTAPAAPTLGGSAAGSYSGSGNDYPTFTVLGETGAAFEYTTNGNAGTPAWIPYSAPGKSLTATGSYWVKGRQKDRAGNLSPASAETRIYTIVPPIPLLTNLSSMPGTYKLGDVIDIEFNLSEAVTVTGATNFQLTLNSNTTPRYAVYNAGASTPTKLVFRYTVQAGDNAAAPDYLLITALGPSNLSGVTVTTVGPPAMNVTTKLWNECTNGTTWLGDTWKLSSVAPITVDTTTPTLTDAGLSADGQTLTMTFNKPIYKGTGSITLTQVETTALPYLVPAVMTREEYQRYGGASLDNYYDRTTNGTNANGDWDLTEKYVLKYNYETNNSTMTGWFKTRGANKVEVPVASGAVTIAGNTMTVNLKSAANGGFDYVLQVKGVSYTLSFTANLVQDSLSNPTAAYTNTTTTYPYNGTNPAYVRIEKNRGVPTGANPVTITQPFTAGVKIDCQTPDATIRYRLTNNSSDPFGGGFPRTQGIPTLTMPTSETTPVYDYNRGNLATTGLTDRSTITWGETDNRNGRLYGIRVTATPPTGYGSTSEYSYEKAARSVIQFTNFDGVQNVGNLKNLVPNGSSLELWLRGGDVISGDNTTPGFPLSWSETDYAGIQMLTKDGDNRYWITWEVNTNAFFHFIAGETGTAAQSANGPIRWVWSKNSWTFLKESFPLHPGESLNFTTGTDVANRPDGTYEFFDRFTNQRTP
jgi:hypothetical protein